MIQKTYQLSSISNHIGSWHLLQTWPLLETCTQETKKTKSVSLPAYTPQAIKPKQKPWKQRQPILMSALMPLPMLSSLRTPCPSCRPSSQTGTLTSTTCLLLLPPFAEAMQSPCNRFPPTASLFQHYKATYCWNWNYRSKTLPLSTLEKKNKITRVLVLQASYHHTQRIMFIAKQHKLAWFLPRKQIWGCSFWTSPVLPSDPSALRRQAGLCPATWWIQGKLASQTPESPASLHLQMSHDSHWKANQ